MPLCLCIQLPNPPDRPISISRRLLPISAAAVMISNGSSGVLITLNLACHRVSVHLQLWISWRIRGRNSVVECQLPKLDVEGSNPFARSNLTRQGPEVAKAASGPSL